MGLFSATPCDECGGTIKRHARNCPAGNTLTGQRGSTRGTCGATHQEKNSPHEHVCRLEVIKKKDGTSSHPGTHVCARVGCGASF